MDCRKFEMTVVSAENLPHVQKTFGQMKVYAEVSIKGSSLKVTKKSDADMERETNPKWYFNVGYTFDETAVHNVGVIISIKLCCKKTLSADKYVGEVDIPLKSLFDAGLCCEKIISYDVAGTPNGKLNISYSFGDPFIAAQKSAGRGGPSLWSLGLGLGGSALIQGVWFLVTGDVSPIISTVGDVLSATTEVITPIISSVGDVFSDPAN